MSQQIQHESSQYVEDFEQDSQQIVQQSEKIVEQQSSQYVEQQTGQFEQQTGQFEQQTDQSSKSGSLKQGRGACDDAADLRKAMKGAGTNEKVIIEILTNRTCSQRQEILKCYNKEFSRDLIADLKEELGGHFEDVILALMTSQPEFLAKDLYKGIKGHKWCTVVEILCPRDSAEIKKITNAYQELHSTTVTDHLATESQNELQDLLVLMARGLRGTSIDPDKARQNAAHLYESPTSRLQETKKAAPIKEAKKEFNVVLLIQILTHDSYGQCQLTFKEFKNLHGQFIEDIVQNELSGDLEKALLCSIDCCRNIPNFFANRLRKAFEGAGTDDITLIRVVVSRFEYDLSEVAAAYEKSYGKTLSRSVENETSGDYKRALLSLIENYPVIGPRTSK